MINKQIEKAKQLVENILKNTYDVHSESKEDKQCFTRQELQQEYLEQILTGDKDSLLNWLEFIGQKDLYREVANF
jgi:flagellar biosynthesis/type III secretory pathway chaperone